MRLIKRAAFAASFSLSLFPFSPNLSAQTSAPQPRRPLVRVRVSLVDRKGRAVTDAKKGDLQVLDDGNPEEIEHFAKDEEPIGYGLVIDGSGSLKSNFQNIVAAARQLIAANRDKDRTFIIKFVSSDNIRTVNAITSDKTELDTSLKGLKIEQGQTALIDGVYLAAQYAINDPNDPTTLVLLSDGEDRASYYKSEILFSLLEKSHLQVFTIGVVGHLDSDQGLIRLSPQQKATDLLTKLARETGGLAFILKSDKELPATIEQLSTIMRSQYIICYRPDKLLNQTNRKVKVKAVDSSQHEKWTVISSRIESIEK